MRQDDLIFNFGCASCGYKGSDTPEGHIDLCRMTARLDSLLDTEDYSAADRLLCYWRGEAQALRDRKGELSVVSEQLGLYRKMLQKEPAEEAVDRALALIEELGVADTVGGATVLLNAATTMKAFGAAERALPYYERARAVYEKELSPDDTRLAGLYNNYALALADLHRAEEAETLYRRAIAITEKTVEGRWDAAISLINLAHLYDGSRDELIPDCIVQAIEYLTCPPEKQNGYYRYVLSKCEPSLRLFGFSPDFS